jgi:CelD/BcsL family acetyltransferase involved in cellulose biosynthesis
MQPKLRLVLHRQIPEDSKFAEQWNQLVHAMECPEVFYTYEWAFAVSRAYASGLTPLVFAAYQGDSLAGIASLATGPGQSQITFLASTTADYCDFVSAPDDRYEFIQLVIEELRRMGFAELRFANVPSDSASASALAAAIKASHYSVFVRAAYVCARALLYTAEDRKQTSKSAIRKLRRMASGEPGGGQIRVVHERDSERVDTEFTQFALAHVGRFLTAGKVSNLVHSERRAFLLELAKLLAVQGWLTFSTLKLDGQTIAWNYGFRFAGSWFWYQPAFDSEQQHLSPGAHLLCEILREASADPEIRTVDLGLGDEGYKQRYAKAGRQTLDTSASRSNLGFAAEVCRYRVAEFIKKSPRVEKEVRRNIARVASLRRNTIQQGYWACLREYFGRRLAGASEVLFFEWIDGSAYVSSPGSAVTPRCNETNLQPVSVELLAHAAMTYADDKDTINYLLRSAARLASGGTGFALVSSTGEPVNFCWVGPFEGFKMAELDHELREPAAESVLLFDCWTPLSERGRGHYGLCTSQVAARLLESGKKPWIFSAATNLSSARALERAGFVQRFSLARKKKLFVSRISMEPKHQPEPVLNLYPAA